MAAAEEALSIAEPLEQWRTVLDAFNTIALVRTKQGRTQEAIALRDRSLALALERDEIEEALRTYNNRADIPLQADHFAEALAIAERGIELARSRGDRRWEQLLSMMITTAGVALGRWDATPELDDRGLPQITEVMVLGLLPTLARVQAGRGDTPALRRTLALATERRGSTNVEYAAGPAVAQAIALRALGQEREALEAALPIATGGVEIANEDRREAYLEAGLAALTLGEEEQVERLITFVAELPPALRSPLLRSGAARLGGLLALKRRELREADRQLAAAVDELRGIEVPFNLAQVLLEHAEVLRALGNEEEAAALLGEARSIFEGLRATPWLERVGRAESTVAA